MELGDGFIACKGMGDEARSPTWVSYFFMTQYDDSHWTKRFWVTKDFMHEL
jgi:hypothetical protein